MLILALITSIRTDPEPAVLSVLNGLDKELAHLIRRRLLVTLLAQYHSRQLLGVPVRARLGLLLLLLLLPVIGIQVPLLRLALNGQIVAKLALLSLFAVALLEEDAHDRLGVHAKGHLLDLRWLRYEGLHLALGCLGGELVALALGLLGRLLLFFGAAAGLHLRVQLGDLLLGLRALLVLHAECAVLDELGGRRLVLAAGRLLGLFWRHDGRLFAGLF